MATEKQGKGIDSDTAIAGVLSLLVANREERIGDGKTVPRKTEILLADAGMSAGDIALVMGRTTGAVAKTIQRGRKS